MKPRCPLFLGGRACFFKPYPIVSISLEALFGSNQDVMSKYRALTLDILVVVDLLCITIARVEAVELFK
jgi:hypothetical protein